MATEYDLMDDPATQETSTGEETSSKKEEPKSLSLNTPEGYETVVKQMQYYLLHVLPEILVSAAEKKHLERDADSHLKQLNTDDASGNVSLISNLARTSNVTIMRKIPPNVLSALVPKIKIFKVSYPSGFRNKKTESSFRVPFDDTVNPKGSGQDIKTILGPRKGGLDLANIVSFNYQYIGTNPAESETSITANLKLKFQTIDALLAERTLLSSDIKSQLAFRYADLVNQAKKGKTLEDPSYYRIKIKVGYQSVTHAFIKNLLQNGENIYSVVEGEERITVDQIAEKFTKAINESNVFLYCYPVAHDLNFNENGTIDLNIDYRGSIERTLVDNESNVLLIGDEAQKVKENIKAAEEEARTKRDELEKSLKSNSISQNEYDTQAEKLDKEINKKTDEAYNSLGTIYNSFIKALYQGDKIRKVNLNNDLLKQVSHWFSSNEIIDNSIMREELISNRYTVGTANLHYDSVNDSTTIDNMIKALETKVTDNKKEKTSNGASATADGKVVGLMSGNELPSSINFIFLQDLIDIVFKKTMESKFKEESIYLILGNITLPVSEGYGNYVIANQKNNTYKQLFFSDAGRRLESGYKYSQYNIGNLPISLEYFNKWFFENVVRPGKSDWKMKNFLYDILELIRLSTMSMFGNKALGLPGSRTLIGMTAVSKKLGDAISEESILNFVTNSKLKSDEVLGIPDSGKAVDSTEISNIIYMYTPGVITSLIDPLKPAEMERDYNIFTFTVGSNVGLLKRISYKKMEIQGLREARSTQEGELATGTFRMKYDADIEMYGPCYFLPGDYIIINPVFLSKQTTEETVKALANDLGLGGIYMVLRTNTDISRDGIGTKLETVFQSYGTLIDGKVRSRNSTVEFASIADIDPKILMTKEEIDNLSEEEKLDFNEASSRVDLLNQQAENYEKGAGLLEGTLRRQ